MPRQFAAVLRVIFVWAGGLVLDGASNGRFGEAWQPESGWLQLVGFGFICVGLLMYTRPRSASGAPPRTKAQAGTEADAAEAAEAAGMAHAAQTQAAQTQAAAASAAFDAANGASVLPTSVRLDDIGGAVDGGAAESTDAALLASMRARSFVRVQARLPAVKALYRACGSMWSQPEEMKQRIAMPPSVKTGVRGGAEYGNAGYLCIDQDKEYCTLRRSRADGRSLPPVPSGEEAAGARGERWPGAGAPSGWSGADFEAAAMRAHRELQAVGERVLDGFERALGCEARSRRGFERVEGFEARSRRLGASLPAGAATSPAHASSLSQLLRYDAGEAAPLVPAGRVAEESNVTLSLLRYVRKGTNVPTSAADPGEVNAAIQAQGTGIPCAPHTDASVLTLIVAPTQPGLELFAAAHPPTEAAVAAAVTTYRRGRSADGATAAGAETAGAWVSGFEPRELTRVESRAERAAEAEEAEAADADADDFVTLVAMGGDMLVHATGGTLPATRHRVVCWPANTQRLSMIMGMYGADDKLLEPSSFRERVCGLPPNLPPEDAGGLPSIGCRASRVQKLYLDPDVRSSTNPERSK